MFMKDIEIPFDQNWKNIAVAVSGGADSAMLLYLILTKIDAGVNIHIINNIRCWKTKPWQQTNFQDVISWFKIRFPDHSFHIHKNFIPPELEWGDIGPTIVDEYGKLVSGDNLELRAFAEFVCLTNNVEAYYNGVTRNPKDVDFKGMPTRDLEPTDSNKYLEQMVHLGIVACHPFRFIEKKSVIHQYYTHKITDLLAITRSCEGVFDNLNYTNYKPGQYVPLCGECFWCKERQWAMENHD